jgi:flagellar protein FlaF
MKYRHKLHSYLEIQRTTGSPREIEAEALTRGAMKLLHCRENWGAPQRKNTLSDALNYNQKLWSIFQAELRNPVNPLPQSLKLNLLRLSAYIDKQIYLIMGEPSPEKLTPIIDINLGIAAGLRKKAVLGR